MENDIYFLKSFITEIKKGIGEDPNSFSDVVRGQEFNIQICVYKRLYIGKNQLNTSIYSDITL